MIIREASLVLRFYRSDGWTRQLVADLGPAIDTVSCRAIETWCDDGLRISEHVCGFDSPKVDFYAVYNYEEAVKIPTYEQLEDMGHELILFTMGG